MQLSADNIQERIITKRHQYFNLSSKLCLSMTIDLQLLLRLTTTTTPKAPPPPLKFRSSYTAMRVEKQNTYFEKFDSLNKEMQTAEQFQSRQSRSRGTISLHYARPLYFSNSDMPLIPLELLPTKDTSR